MPQHLLVFTLTTAVLLVVPGPDFLLVTRVTLLTGRGTGLAAAAGVITSLASHTALAALGVTVLVSTSETALAALRFAGAGYLVWLGGKAMTDLWRARRHRAATGPALRPANGWSPFLHGLVTNGLNPKAVLFFLTFLPQFVTPAAPAGGQILLLGGIVVALAAAWWVGYVLAADRVAPLLRRPRVRDGVDAASGVTLTALGGALLLGW